MGNYRSRRPGFIEAWKIQAAELMFQGMIDEDIAKILWPLQFAVEDEDRLKKNRRNALTRLRMLRKEPKFQEYYNSLVTEWKVHSLGPALKALRGQVDQKKDLWLQNKAANDILNNTKELHQSKEENAITVKFEGMPELGVPGADEE